MCIAAPVPDPAYEHVDDRRFQDEAHVLLGRHAAVRSLISLLNSSFFLGGPATCTSEANCKFIGPSIRFDMCNIYDLDPHKFLSLIFHIEVRLKP
jgi:hypothetical protein